MGHRGGLSIRTELRWKALIDANLDFTFTYQLSLVELSNLTVKIPPKAFILFKEGHDICNLHKRKEVLSKTWVLFLL